MTRYLVYQVTYGFLRKNPSRAQAMAIIDEEYCVCDNDSDEPAKYVPNSEVWDLAVGNTKSYNVLLETTSIEEFLESEHTAFVDPDVVQRIKRICL